MAGLSEGIQARLRALADTFTEELPRRMQQIADSARSALGEETTIGEIRTLRHHAHKLAGSAATFGFHHVTACAKRLEHA
ncbi:MAG: Hpt domain-containing protein, partial [Spirochaetota bacterium]